MRFEPSRPLDRDSLVAALEQEGVSPDSYNLVGARANEAYVLAARPGAWATFYAERGLETSRRQFDTEDAACADLLDRILADPTTRR